MPRLTRTLIAGWLASLTLLAGCNLVSTAPAPTLPPTPTQVILIGDGATVLRIIDGDTIDVDVNGETIRVRYIGVNTPEYDEPCFEAASAANRALVGGRAVTLVRDVSETDPFGRRLRYVYVDGLSVNAELVRAGYAEAVEYPPDVTHAAEYEALEAAARAANRGCHAAGVFDD